MNGQIDKVAIKTLIERRAWPMNSTISVEGAYNVARRILCEHDYVALFGPEDKLRQYWKCSHCGNINT